tara:strand:- start:1670 stop:2440 length:771 start_codon:yes stop_codon:yes gene_type:complete
LKNKFTILGCGSSLGSPWINSFWGNCDKVNKKNQRSRCCAHIRYKNLSILIDTSPDIKRQLISNNIKNVDSILYTHEHADQTAGIFEFRPIYFMNKKKIPIYCNLTTQKKLKSAYPWLFKSSALYPKIMFFKNSKNNIFIEKNNIKFKIKAFNVVHGKVKTRGYLFNKIAYISDCNGIPMKSLRMLKNLNYLIIDCFRERKHVTHFNYDEALEIIKILKPKKSILTNLHVDFDYKKLKKKLPANVTPAYDGMNFNF